ncbi:MAG: SOS response-associated peptidase [Candidatus Tectomicrobia bacterium]|nr:SOS response-associated peptidase [Candidatus Tectomicrobia bacterium]
MCGRFTLASEVEQLQERFAFEPGEMVVPPSYNIAPGQDVVAVVRDGAANRAGWLRWGLVPSWAKDVKIGYKMTNARAETVAEKPSFRSALRQRRCLVLADGYYEWRREGKQKIPMYIRLGSRNPFAFAGLWETWQGAEGEPLSTCTILTTAANAALQAIHQRMPVILDPDRETLWLDREVTDPERLLPLLTPAMPESIEAYAVSTWVNSARNNSPACIEPLEAE